MALASAGCLIGYSLRLHYQFSSTLYACSTASVEALWCWCCPGPVRHSTSHSLLWQGTSPRHTRYNSTSADMFTARSPAG
jgi:hypothetical protein